MDKQGEVKLRLGRRGRKAAGAFEGGGTPGEREYDAGEGWVRETVTRGERVAQSWAGRLLGVGFAELESSPEPREGREP